MVYLVNIMLPDIQRIYDVCPPIGYFTIFCLFSHNSSNLFIHQLKRKRKAKYLIHKKLDKRARKISQRNVLYEYLYRACCFRQSTFRHVHTLVQKFPQERNQFLNMKSCTSHHKCFARDTRMDLQLHLQEVRDHCSLSLEKS